MDRSLRIAARGIEAALNVHANSGIGDVAIAITDVDGAGAAAGDHEELANGCL